jgi:N-methylhydantoinase A
MKGGTLDLKYWIGIDTGGTFTDCVIMDENGNLASGKVPTTPDDRSIGVINSTDAAAEAMGMKLEDVLKNTELFAQSSTTGINALLTRTGRPGGGRYLSQGHRF